MTEQSLIDALNTLARDLDPTRKSSLTREQVMRHSAMQLRAIARCLTEVPLERSPRPVSQYVREIVDEILQD